MYVSHQMKSTFLIRALAITKEKDTAVHKACVNLVSFGSILKGIFCQSLIFFVLLVSGLLFINLC